jgi:hypothetical protein
MKIKPEAYQSLIEKLIRVGSNPFRQQTNSIATASVLGIKANQKIETSAFYSPEKTSLETISESQFVHTAFRCSRANNQLLITEASTKEELEQKEPKKYLFQDYLSIYGILPLPIYYVRDFETKKEFTSQLVMNKEEGNVCFGFLPYDLREDTILNYEEKEDSITLELHPDFSTKHYQKQMMKIGGFTEKPSFKAVSVTFFLNQHGEICGYLGHESSHAKLGILNIDFVIETKSTHTKG